MACPRCCASRSKAKVESPRMLIRSIGSICTATLRVIDCPRTRLQLLASNAAVIWRGMRPGATSMASKRMSRMRSSGYCASQASAAPAMRMRWLSVTDQAASSRLSRALTSTKTRRRRRRATMSISPSGQRQRRARMRNPLATRNAAARLSAEIPVRNAICRSERGGSTGLARGRSSLMVAVLGERQRALIDLAPRGTGDGGDFGDGFLQRQPRERGADERVEVERGRLFFRIGRRDHDCDLPARRRSLSGLARERCERAVTHLLVKLGQLAADRSLARPEAVSEVGERGGKARPRLEQYERRRDALEL